MYEGKEDPSNNWNNRLNNNAGDLASMELTAAELDTYVQERAATSSRGVGIDRALQRLGTQERNNSSSSASKHSENNSSSSSTSSRNNNSSSSSDEVASARQFLSKVDAAKQQRDDVIERAIGRLEASQAAREAALRAQHAAAEAALRREHEALLEVSKARSKVTNREKEGGKSRSKDGESFKC